MKTIDALERTKNLEPQTSIELAEGMKLRRTRAGIPVVRVQHDADPARRGKEWLAKTRAEYSSDAAFRREILIEDEAGGGELVFADTLVTYWKKIVIEDPVWRPDPRWRVEGGFDHGKTNPTALLRCYFDHEGTRYFCGEYYQPGWEIWQHAPMIRKMADITRLAACHADPTIFDTTMQQSQQPGKAHERAKSINMLYVEQGIELFSPFGGDRSDISFAARVMQHWANLDKSEPTLKIVCRNYSERPQHGLHDWDCPNLLWELMRRRRVKLTAQQLLSRNASEALVDKENHASDAGKYIEMSWPEPTLKTAQEKAREAIEPLAEIGDLTSAAIRYQQIMKAEESRSQPVRLGRRGGIRRR